MFTLVLLIISVTLFDDPRFDTITALADPFGFISVQLLTKYWMQTLEVEGARLEKEYPRFSYRIYRFASPMQPGETRKLRFTTLLEERGFPNRAALTRIVANGTFIDNSEVSPFLGMSRFELLRDRAKRRKYGLPAELRPAKLEDPAANYDNYIRKDSDWVNAELRVTTDADQTPIAPGYTVSDTVTGTRRTLVTRTDSPILNFFSMQSARYAVKKDVWTSAAGTPVSLAVYFSPGHESNVQRMLDAMQLSLQMFSDRFSPFQFRQARILEFPAYDIFAQSFAAAGPQHAQLITDLFEKITLYDMQASNATAKRRADGKYQVSFTVKGRKLYADGEGQETEAPLAESFDVGAFLAEPGKRGYTSKAALRMERQVMRSGEQKVTLTLEQLPRFVGVDPYNKRVDRNSDDNLTAVVVE